MKVSSFGESVNSLLRKLSYLGTIEELTIVGGAVDNEDDNVPPILFKQLRSVRWTTYRTEDELAIISALTK